MTVGTRKHVLDDDDDEYCNHSVGSHGESMADRSGKRIKLDSLLEDLHLNDDKPTHSFIDKKDKGKRDSYIIPHVKSPFGLGSGGSGGGIFKKPNAPQSYTLSQLDNYINGRIVDHFQNIITSNMKMITWYNFKFLIVYVYRRWFVKLFNRFLRKYNTKNQSKIHPFNTYEKVLQLIPEGHLTWNDLKKIIAEENRLEIKRLQLKQEVRESQKESDSIKREAEEYKGLGYNYWDNLKLDGDLDMLDDDADEANEPVKKIVELKHDDPDDRDVQMNDESGSGYVEANYGTYYPSHAVH
ncbi:uncharacterized protein LODBEIA_P10050 [Lodderomyces beijingensis]|uniref:Uncharacterized protein n=1 Tax=Lodderomyces beijingensis TaxID=1775926 RepID=A0ABP0ZIW8_9ASCO